MQYYQERACWEGGGGGALSKKNCEMGGGSN